VGVIITTNRIDDLLIIFLERVISDE